MNAEILTIGTELLLGEITDTNTGYLARKLASVGVNVFRTTSVGDNEQRIAECIQEILSRVDLLITTGGLGPTVDDPTRSAVAMALNRETEFHPELWEEIQQLFRNWGHTAADNNRRQAFLPQGAKPIHNPVGTAPGFLVETDIGTIISLPGVPLEMETLTDQVVLPYIQTRLSSASTIRVRLLHTVGLGESMIDEQISEFETLKNPTVGLAAHAGQVDIRLTARAASIPEADRLLDDLEAELRERLEKQSVNPIYGVDSTTLADAAMSRWEQQNMQLTVIESGLESTLSTILNHRKIFSSGIILPPVDLAEFEAIVNQKADLTTGMTLCVHLQTSREHILSIKVYCCGAELAHQQRFGGPPQAAPQRAANLTLNFLRSTDLP